MIKIYSPIIVMTDPKCLLASLEAIHYMTKYISLFQPCYRMAPPQLQNNAPAPIQGKTRNCVGVVHFFEFRHGFVLYNIDERHERSRLCALPQMHCKAAPIPARALGYNYP